MRSIRPACSTPAAIVQPPRMDDRTLFRYGPDYAPVTDFAPKLDWSDHPGPLGGMLGAVEMCNNNGTCRAFDAGVMCPSYRATRDEQHLTRGRANTLRLALTGQLGADAMASDALAEAMKLCVSCKACRRECPTGVDMAKMKIEVLAARADRHGVALRERLVADLPRYGAVAGGAGAAGQSAQPRPRAAPAGRAPARPRRRRAACRNGGATPSATREADGHVRPRPRHRDAARRHVQSLVRAGEPARGACGCWPPPAIASVMPRAGGRPLCCGRTWLAAGHDRAGARRGAPHPGGAAPATMPVIGLEPSCLLTLRDEFRALLPGAEADALAGRAVLLSEFLAREQPALALRPIAAVAHVHGHCHQKAFGAFPDALAALRRVPDLTVRPIASSCCGMAGAFGYQAETQDVSRAMAEAGLLPAVRAAGADDVIVADGTSCRHQIADLAGREAIHSVRLLDRALA